MRRVLLVITALVSVMILMVVVRLSRLPATTEVEDPQHVTIAIPQGYSYGLSNFGRQLDISPDGKKVVYVGRVGLDVPKLLLHTIGETIPHEIPGSDGANDPSFSPDGRYIAFYSAGSILKADLNSGATVVLGKTSAPRGVAWLDNETLILGNTQGPLLRLSGLHGELTPLVDADSKLAHLSPNLLPGNKAVLCTIANGPLVKARIALVSLETGEEKQLLDENAFAPRYSPTGHIVFARGLARQLMAVRFDLSKLEIVGSAVPVLNTALSGQGSGGSTDYGISSTGALVYTPRFEPTINDALAQIGNLSLREIHVQLSWSEELKRMLP